MALALAIMPMGAIAEECVPWTSDPEVDVALPTGERYYVEWDCPLFLGKCGGISLWIYEETNGLDGLQRNDDFSGDNACGNGDMIVF